MYFVNEILSILRKEIMSNTDSRYMLRGVSSAKEDVHNAIKNIDKGLYPKAFCKIIPDMFTGDPDYWDAMVMNTDDLLCVGIADGILVSSTIGRNKNLIPGEVISAIISGTDEFIKSMERYGIRMTLTGGETADVGDLVRTVIVDSTVCARVRRSDIIDNSRISAGDVIVGLASFGQAEYEDEYNGGTGSNGLTSARHDLFAHYLADKYPESYDHAMPVSLVYSGSRLLTEIEPETGLTYGKLLLSPTRTYAPVMKRIFDGYKDRIHGNMGHRMEIYTDRESASAMIDISRSLGVDARIIGHVEASDKAEVVISGENGKFVYNN